MSRALLIKQDKRAHLINEARITVNVGIKSDLNTGNLNSFVGNIYIGISIENKSQGRGGPAGVSCRAEIIPISVLLCHRPFFAKISDFFAQFCTNQNVTISRKDPFCTVMGPALVFYFAKKGTNKIDSFR